MEMKSQARDSEHPGVEILAAFLDGRLSSEEREQVAGHLDVCESCRGELSIAAGALADHDERKRRRRWLVPLVAAAAAATLLFLPVDRIFGPENPSTIQRGERSEGTTVFGIISPQEREVVTRSELILEWRSAGPTATYEVTVMDSRGDPLWSLTTGETAARPPLDVNLSPGQYYWRVDALLEGASSATTGAHEFTITQ